MSAVKNMKTIFYISFNDTIEPVIGKDVCKVISQGNISYEKKQTNNICSLSGH